MIVSNTHTLQGYEIVEYLGIVSTSEVYIKGRLGGDAAVWNDIVGKVVKGITKEATKAGADAVVGFTIVPDDGSARGMGTAVKIKKI